MVLVSIHYATGMIFGTIRENPFKPGVRPVSLVVR